MTLVYRVEKKNSDQGLWYTNSAELRPIVDQLKLNCARLPMGYDPEYSKDGITWSSGCSNPHNLLDWFSFSELKLLESKGFKIYEFNASKVRNYSGHQIFCKNSLKSEAREFTLKEFLEEFINVKTKK